MRINHYKIFNTHQTTVSEAAFWSFDVNPFEWCIVSYDFICLLFISPSSLGFLKVQTGPCAREVAHLEALHSPSHPGSKDTSKITMERWIWMIFPIMKLRKKYLIQDTSDTSVVSFQLLWKLSCHHVTAVTSGAQTLGSVESPPRWAHVQFELLKIYRTLQFKDTSTNINRDISITSTYINYRWCMMYPKCHLELNTKKTSTVLESISCWSWTLKVVQKPWSFGTLPTLPLTPLSTDF